MLEVRRDGWWARCWRNEPLPKGDLVGADVVRLCDVPTYSEPRRPAKSFGVERWQHLGGTVAYAMVGFEFEPARIGQLVVQTPEIGQEKWRELIVAALASVKWALADELGPGRLTLTHFKSDEVDTSVFSIATAACAAAFVATHPLDEIEPEVNRLLLRPCQFEGDVQNVWRLPESVAGRAAVRGLVLAGPWVKGDVRVGDELVVEYTGGTVVAEVLSFPMINYGSRQPIWMSIEVDIDEDVEVALSALATGVPHWRPPADPTVSED